MDVIAFEKADIHESIACLGTACTKEQMTLLKRLNVPLVVCYDGDRAGKAATYKFGKLAVDYGLNFSIVKIQRVRIRMKFLMNLVKMNCIYPFIKPYRLLNFYSNIYQINMI